MLQHDWAMALASAFCYAGAPACYAVSDPRAVGQQFVLRPQTSLLLAYAHEAVGDNKSALSAVTVGLDFATHGAHIWKEEFARSSVTCRT